MAKITVENVGKAIITSDSDLEKWRKAHGVKVLYDSDGFEVVSFAGLEDGGHYTLTGPENQGQNKGE